MIDKKYCKGCRSYDNDVIIPVWWCEAHDILSNRDCPCINCLVKPMCGDACGVYMDSLRLKRERYEKEEIFMKIQWMMDYS